MSWKKVIGICTATMICEGALIGYSIEYANRREYNSDLTANIARSADKNEDGIFSFEEIEEFFQNIGADNYSLVLDSVRHCSTKDLKRIAQERGIEIKPYQGKK
jgi:hypothetical protein